MSEELKENLQQVSTNLQSIASTNATIARLVQGASIRVVGVPEKEGEEPPVLSISGEEMIQAMMAPVSRETSTRKERNLAAKESLLRALEAELTGGDTAKTSEAVEKPEKAEKSPPKKAKKE